MRSAEVHNYDFAFRQAAIGMALIAPDGAFIKVNPALCTLLGYTPDHFTLPDLLLPAIQELSRDIVKCGEWLQSMKRDQHRIDQHYYHPSGQRLSLDIRISLIRNEAGKPEIYFTQFENRTQMMQMETRLHYTETHLHEREDSFMQLLDGLPLSVLITNHGQIQYANPAGLRLIHADSLEAVIGMSTDVLVDAADHEILAERKQRHYNNRPIGSVRYRIRCLNGQLRHVEGFSLKITYQKKRCVIGIFKDISDQKLEEDRLMQSEKLSTAGQLAAGIAHEIRNPLTAIFGFLKLLRTSSQNNDQYFAIMESELKRIEFIVNELLVLSKPQVSHASKPMDILPLLDQVITLMNGQAALKNIEIVSAFSEPSIWIAGEANQLKQVFINLLKNAMEAMPEGGIIRIHALSRNNEAFISVQDEGCGMTAEQIQALGKPFFTTKESGTGLGFMITHNIIHNHGGNISVQSALQEGTTFTVTLPVISEPEAASS